MVNLRILNWNVQQLKIYEGQALNPSKLVRECFINVSGVAQLINRAG